LEGPHLSSDLATLVVDLTPQREHVAGHHPPGVDYHVALDSDEVAVEMPVDVRPAIDDEQVAAKIIRGAQTEIPPARSPSRHREANHTVG
jgi:hypothetical protein